MARNALFICTVSASLLLGACDRDRLECTSTSVNWGETLANIGPLPEYETALAYHKSEVVRAQLKQWRYNFDEFEWIQGDKSGTQGFVAANDHHVIVSFRGTSSVKDLKVDLSSLPTPEKGTGGSVHSGFQSALALEDDYKYVDESLKRTTAYLNESGDEKENEDE